MAHEIPSDLAADRGPWRRAAVPRQPCPLVGPPGVKVYAFGLDPVRPDDSTPARTECKEKAPRPKLAARQRSRRPVRWLTSRVDARVTL